MALIKSISAPSSLAPFSMTDIENQAQAVLARARDQAARIMLEAAKQAAELKKHAFAAGQVEGRKAGHLEGLEEGRKLGTDQALEEQRAELCKLVATFSAGLKELDNTRSMLESHALSEVIRLAVAIARRVTRLHGAASGQVVAANVADALKLVVRSTDVRVAINPQQKKTVEDVLPRLKTLWPNLEHITLTEDEGIAPGGCRVFAGAGWIDADLETQIDRISSDLLATAQHA